MTRTRASIHLNAFLLADGHHEAAWRRPGHDPRRVMAFDHVRELAQLAEGGLFDSLFLADNLALSANAHFRSQSPFEPLTLLAALAPVTHHIGLIATASTTYSEPFHLSRQLASIDHLSSGRAGWNIVTSAYHDEARNFGRDNRPDHETRYERAAAHLAADLALWDSWDADAVVADTARGHWFDPARVHALRTPQPGGFEVQGPATGPRSPAGRPVLVQAGASATGTAFAARHAEVVFTAADSIERARTFYADLKAQVAAAGRDPDSVLVLPGLATVVGDSEAAARADLASLDALVVPEYGVQQLGKILDADLSRASLDGPLPEVPAHTEGMQGRRELIVELARREQLTIRQLVQRLAGGRGHHVVAGTPEQIADEIELWCTTGAADGFNVMPPRLPEDLASFVDHVVPELQQRGLFRTEYGATTLRGNLGLALVSQSGSQS